MKVEMQNNGKTSYLEFQDNHCFSKWNVGTKIECQYYESLNSHPSLVTVELIADGRSLLIGNQVVRIGKQVKEKKQNVYLTRTGKGSLKLSESYFNIKRAVEPRTLQKSTKDTLLKSPMTGKILSCHLKAKDSVKEGDVLLIIEAMKMENRIFAESDGEIDSVFVQAGQTVQAGDKLVVFAKRN